MADKSNSNKELRSLKVLINYAYEESKQYLNPEFTQLLSMAEEKLDKVILQDFHKDYQESMNDRKLK